MKSGPYEERVQAAIRRVGIWNGIVTERRAALPEEPTLKQIATLYDALGRAATAGREALGVVGTADPRRPALARAVVGMEQALAEFSSRQFGQLDRLRQERAARTTFKAGG